jgi:hypothetical protein
MAGVDGAFEERAAGIARRDGKLCLDVAGRDEPVPVTVHYLRPLTTRTEIVFLDDKRSEVLSVSGLDAFQGAERELVADALRERYCLATIERVHDIDVRFGTRYWRVATDRGPRWFALREPGKNVVWLDADHVVLRDTAGNRFEIRNLGALDRRSRLLVRRSL